MRHERRHGDWNPAGDRGRPPLCVLRRLAHRQFAAGDRSITKRQFQEVYLLMDNFDNSKPADDKPKAQSTDTTPETVPADLAAEIQEFHESENQKDSSFREPLDPQEYEEAQRDHAAQEAQEQADSGTAAAVITTEVEP